MIKTKIGGETIVVRKPGVLASQVNDEIVILNINKGEYNGLDSIGSDIWNELENPIRINDLVEKLMDKYDVGLEDCTRDVVLFLSELIEFGLADIKNGKQ